MRRVDHQATDPLLEEGPDPSGQASTGGDVATVHEFDQAVPASETDAAERETEIKTSGDFSRQRPMDVVRDVGAHRNKAYH